MQLLFNQVEIAIQAATNITGLECDIIVIPEMAAGGHAGFASKDSEENSVICVSDATPYGAVCEVIAEVAAGLASETREETQQQLKAMIFDEYQRLCAAESEAGTNE